MNLHHAWAYHNFLATYVASQHVHYFCFILCVETLLVIKIITFQHYEHISLEATYCMMFIDQMIYCLGSDK